MSGAALDIPLDGRLTEEQARQIYALGEEAVVFALLALTKMLAAQQSTLAATSHQTPATPSGMQPPYLKPAPGRRKKKPGRKQGHLGSRRPAPGRIDHTREHPIAVCPFCAGPVTPCRETSIRYTEDIPETASGPETTQHTIHVGWCGRCNKKVRARVVQALPGATLGNRVLVLSAWLHYALGVSLSQLVEVFAFHLAMPVTPGGLVQMWRRLAAILEAWYEAIREEALHGAVLHADETGWRVNGQTHWLWCFASPDLSRFLIDRSRGSPALKRFFTREFAGTLVSDFWTAYDAVLCAARQTCLVHLLRELEHTEKYKGPGPHWPAFAQKLRRLVGDAIRLRRRREELPAEQYAARRAALGRRLQALIDAPWQDRHARRLAKRLRRHQQDLFTFLDQPAVPFDNNLAERAIRPAVLLRKGSYGNRSQEGAQVQAILMSVFFTLKKRGHNPVKTLQDALAVYLETGHLPPLPTNVTANG